MDERDEDAERWLWTLVDDQTAVRWEQDPQTNEWSAVQLVMHGLIDSARLKAIRFRDISPTGRMCFGLAAGAVPTQEKVAALWSRGDMTVHHAELGRPMILPAGERSSALLVYSDAQGRTNAVPWQPRGERSPAEFYQQVAGVFVHLQQAYPRSATKHLGELAGVPYTTAVKWVREARARDYLPESAHQLRNKKAASDA